MTCQAILEELKAMGNENTKRTLLHHGAKEPLYGVKVEDLKKLQKKIKKNYGLALALYNTGISDACYLAGLVADETKMTRQDLQHWAENASWHMISEYTVPWIAAESHYGLELALEWIDTENEGMQAAGWCTLSSLAAIKNDEDLNLTLYQDLLFRVQKEIQNAPNRTRYAMNNFIISTGSYIKALTPTALAVANTIGNVKVDMGGTACKVPLAKEYIQKMIGKEAVGKKKKMARC